MHIVTMSSSVHYVGEIDHTLWLNICKWSSNFEFHMSKHYENSVRWFQLRMIEHLVNPGIRRSKATGATSLAMLWCKSSVYSFLRRNTKAHIHAPWAPAPYVLASFNSFSALANFAVETTFMDWVIFWMFFTDFSLNETGHYTENTCTNHHQTEEQLLGVYH